MPLQLDGIVPTLAARLVAPLALARLRRRFNFVAGTNPCLEPRASPFVGRLLWQVTRDQRAPVDQRALRNIEWSAARLDLIVPVTQAFEEVVHSAEGRLQNKLNKKLSLSVESGYGRLWRRWTKSTRAGSSEPLRLASC